MLLVELTRKELDGFHKLVVNFDNVVHYAPSGHRTRLTFVSAHAPDEGSACSILVEESVPHVEALLAQGGEIVVRFAPEPADGI